MSNQGRGRGGGFTLIEALIVVACFFLLIGILGPVMLATPRGCGGFMKDSSQLRGIHQSMIMWAMQNQERFPLASLVDPEGLTVDVGQRDDPSQAFKLDSTRNIFSLMIFNGMVPPEMFISPSEQGPIIEYEGYQIAAPDAAIDPSKALWDPGFRATPRDRVLAGQSEEGSFSYVHPPPFARRRDTTWRDTYSPAQAILANRGPSWKRGSGGGWELLDESHDIAADYSKPIGKHSNTLLIYGSRKTWEGYVVYQDGRVIFETQPDPEDLPYTFSSLGVCADNLFVNEDDATGLADDEQTLDFTNDNLNAFLRSYSDRIGGSSVNDVRLEVFYD